MIDLTPRRLAFLSAISAEEPTSREQILARSGLRNPVMSAANQKALSKMAELGLIEAWQDERRNWMYKRTAKGARLLELLESDSQEPINLTLHRQQVLRTLGEKFYLTRVEFCGFLHAEADDPNLEITYANKQALKALAEWGLVEIVTEPANPKKSRKRLRYRRTDKGTELLKLLGYELEF